MQTLLCFARPRRALAFAATLLALPACIVVTADDDNDRLCTLIGCAEGFTVEVAPRAGAWAPGAYRFDIVADGRAIVCEASLPLAVCGPGPASRCDSPDVVLAESGCALPADQHAFEALYWFQTQPASVSVTITRDGAGVAEGQFDPTYAESYPNGPGCGPACRSAPAARVDVF